MKPIKLYAAPNHRHSLVLAFKYIGFAMMLVGVFSTGYDVLTGWASLGGGLVYFAFFFYEFSEVKYIITDTHIKSNSLLGRSIRIDSIQLVKVFADDVIFVSHNSIFRIETQCINEASLTLLEDFVLSKNMEVDILPSKKSIDD